MNTMNHFKKSIIAGLVALTLVLGLAPRVEAASHGSELTVSASGPIVGGPGGKDGQETHG
jgi:hypothetical protein